MGRALCPTKIPFNGDKIGAIMGRPSVLSDFLNLSHVSLFVKSHYTSAKWDFLHNHKETTGVVFINPLYPPILGAPDRSGYTWALPIFYSPYTLSSRRGGRVELGDTPRPPPEGNPSGLPLPQFLRGAISKKRSRGGETLRLPRPDKLGLAMTMGPGSWIIRSSRMMTSLAG
jgi:hypothetical protein